MSTKSPHIRGVVFSTVAVAVSLALSYSAGPPRTRIFHFDYQVAVEKIPVGTRHIDVWVPIPHEDAHQRITNLRVYAAYPCAMEQATDGNTMLHIGRDNPNEPFTVTFSLDAQRQDVPSRLPGGPRLERDEDPRELAQYLHPDRLSRMFRGKFLALLRDAFADGKLQFHGPLAAIREPAMFHAWLRR